MFILYIYYRTKTVLVIRALALIHFQVSLISILWGDYLVISGKWGSYVNLNKAHKHFVFSHNTTKCTTNFMKIDKHVRLSVMRRHTVSWCYHFFHINLTRQPIESVRWTLQPSFSFVFFIETPRDEIINNQIRLSVSVRILILQRTHFCFVLKNCNNGNKPYEHEHSEFLKKSIDEWNKYSKKASGSFAKQHEAIQIL